MRAPIFALMFCAASATGKSPTVEIAPGVHMPLAAFGTAEYKGDGAVKAIQMAMSLGYVALDTAHGYGIFDPSYDQKSVGKAVKGYNRSSFFLITKVPGGKTKADTAKNLDDDLKILGLDYVDLVLIHHPVSVKGQTLEASIQAQWAALEDFHTAGKARAIGVSNFCAQAMASLLATAKVTPAVNQVLYHAGMGVDPDGIKSRSKTQKIQVQAFSAMDEGSAALRGEPFVTIGKAHNKSATQVALRWLVQQDPPTGYVAASSKQEHQMQNIDIFDFELSKAEMTTINNYENCDAGGMTTKNCKPYWPGSEGCNECCCKTFPAGFCCCPKTTVV